MHLHHRVLVRGAMAGLALAIAAACGGRTIDLDDRHSDASVNTTSGGAGGNSGSGVTIGAGPTGSVTTGVGPTGSTGPGTTGPGSTGPGTTSSQTGTTMSGTTTVGPTTVSVVSTGPIPTGGPTTTFSGAGGSGIGGSGGQGGAAGSGPNPDCNPNNCPGCCDALHRCRSGRDLDACGVKAAQCIDCAAGGFACTANGICDGVAPACGPATCTGCCTSTGQCRIGRDTDACGYKGGPCEDCAPKGLGCLMGVCQGMTPKCDATTCGGCCDAGGKCQAGTTDLVCGSQGAACRSCPITGQTCAKPGSYCASTLPCSTVCSSGCCDAKGVCQTPSDTACGTRGQTCSDCKAQGRVCAPQGYCYAGTSCGPQNCAGCCTSTGQCIDGSDAASCGQFGSLCDNCTSKNQACINRVCSTGSVCPASFPGCSPGAVTDPPATSTSCTNADLAVIARACAGAAVGCGAAFMRLLGTNPSCGGCLAQFVDNHAIARCLAPFMSSACNHSLTCGLECTNASCSQCPPGRIEPCQQNVGQAGGTCNAYAYGWSCALTAFQGPAAFCNWETYNDAGLWLNAVGRYYCMPH